MADYRESFIPNNVGSVFLENTRCIKPRLIDDVEAAFDEMLLERSTPLDVDKEDVGDIGDMKAIIAKLQDTNTQLKDLQDKITVQDKLARSLKKNYDDFVIICSKLKQDITCSILQTKEDMHDEFSKKLHDFIDVTDTLVNKCIKDAKREKDNLERERKKVMDKHARVQSIISAGMKSLVSEKDAHRNICPVCFDKDVNVVLTPCGHTVCKTCSGLIGKNCMTCRQPFTHVYDIFFSV